MRASISDVLRVVRLGALYIGGALFGWLFHERYWKWRDCIAQSSSSCGDPESFNATGGGAIWLLPCLVLLSMAIVGTVRWVARRRRRSG